MDALSTRSLAPDARLRRVMLMLTACALVLSSISGCACWDSVFGGLGTSTPGLQSSRNSAFVYGDIMHDPFRSPAPVGR